MDGVDIDFMVPASTLNKYVNMECNNDYHTPLMAFKMSTLKSSVSTLTLPYVTSRNDELFSSQNPIHEKIKYSYLSKTQERAVFMQVM